MQYSQGGYAGEEWPTHAECVKWGPTVKAEVGAQQLLQMGERVLEEFTGRAEIRCFVVIFATPQREPADDGAVRGCYNSRVEAGQMQTIDEGGEGPEKVLRPRAPCATGKSARAQCSLRVPSILGKQQPTVIR